MNITPELLYSRLIYRKNYFKEFNWNDNFNDSIPLKNVSNNKYYNKREKVFKLICEKYPLQRDIDDFIDGFFLNNSNIYNINLNEISSVITKWNYLRRNYTLIIKEDCYRLKDYLKENNLQFDEIFNCKNDIPIIYNIYKEKIISELTLGYLYYTNNNQLEKIKVLTKKKSKSLEKNLYFSDVFKAYKIIKLLSQTDKRKD